MEPLRGVLLVVALITLSTCVKIEEGTSQESNSRRFPVQETEDATLPFDGDDYLEEYTGFDEKALQEASQKENITIGEIFGNDTNTERYEDNSVSNDKGALAFQPDVNATVTAVEKILANNPYLPKLSRSEILEIFDNITTAVNKNLTTVVVKGKDMNISNKGLERSKFRSRDEYARALMLVMPFNAKDMSDPSVQELYTRAPVTQMILEADSNGVTPKYERYRRPNPERNEVNTQNNQFVAKPGTNIYRQIINMNKTRNEYTSTRPYLRRSDTVTRQPVDQTTAKSNRFDSTAQFIESTKSYRSNKTREPFPTMRPLAGRDQISARLPTPRPKNQPTQRPLVLKNNRLQTKETRDEVHPYVDQYQRTKLRKPNPSASFTNNHQTAMFSNRTTEAVTTPTTPILQYQEIQPFRPLPADMQSKNNLNSNTINPVVSAKLRKHALGLNVVNGAFVQPSIQHSQLAVLDNTKEQPEFFEETTTSTLYMTPIALRQTQNDFNEWKAATTVETPTTPAPVRNDIRDVLASLGLYPDTNENPGYSYVTTKAPSPDISAGASALSPDFQEMLKSFGLLPSPSENKPVVHHLAIKKSEAIPPRAQTSALNQDYVPRSILSEVDTDAYSSFKPIPPVKMRTPTNQQVSEDMQQFLASFGLGPGRDSRKALIGEKFSSRVQKSLNTNHDQIINSLVKEKEQIGKVNMEILTEDMRKVLENLGLVDESDNSAKEDEREEDELLTFNESARQDHVFNPVEHAPTKDQTDELERLNKVLETVKHLQDDKGTISQEEKLAKLLDTVQFLTKTNATFTQQDIDELNAAINLKPQPYFEQEERRPVYKSPSRKKTPLDQSFDSPNPIDVDDLINSYIKNEIKRQEPKNETVSEKTTDSTERTSATSEAEFTSDADTTSEAASTPEVASTSEAASTSVAASASAAASTTAEASTSAKASSTSESADGAVEAAATIMPEESEDRKPSFADLADSFGGGLTADETPAEIETPPKRPNGLYFLLDWNSFLEVGEEGKGKVDIKIGPKVGNPKNFLPVTVP